MDIIYLAADEQAKFDKLPEELRSAWNVVSEQMTCYESPAQIRMRYHMMGQEKNSPIMILAEKVLGGADLSSISFDDIPEELHPKFYFTIGARGTAAIIWDLLPRVASADDVRGLAALSLIRHRLLELNSTVSPMSHGS